MSDSSLRLDEFIPILSDGLAQVFRLIASGEISFVNDSRGHYYRVSADEITKEEFELEKKEMTENSEKLNEIKNLEKIRDKYCHLDEVVVIDKILKKLSRYDIGSGVIIPDVEMPKNCHECDSCGLSDIVGLKCPCDVNKELYSHDKRPEECPLKVI